MYDELILLNMQQLLDEKGNTVTDDYGMELPPIEHRKRVPAEVSSVGQAEFYKAAEMGFKADLKLITFIGNYGGEEYALFKGKRYKIYRYFAKDDENVELYLTGKLGDG